MKHGNLVSEHDPQVFIDAVSQLAVARGAIVPLALS